MSCAVLISEFEAPSRPACSSSFHTQLLQQFSDKRSLRLPLQGACNEDGSAERQQEAHRPASCMSDYPHPYVWNSANQRYEPRISSYAADSQRQHESEQQERQQQQQRYSAASPPSRVLNYQHQQPPLDDWNPWAYLDSNNQQPYTPSQPAVGADLPSPYDPYRLPSIQQQGLADTYDPHEYQASGASSSGYPATFPRPAATTPRDQLPYLQESYHFSHYYGWTPETVGSSFAQAGPPESYTLPPLNRQYTATAVDSATTSEPLSLYKPNDASRPLDLRAPRPLDQASHTSPASALLSYHDYTSSTPRSASSEQTSYLGSTTRQRRLSDPDFTWEEFQIYWKGYLTASESALREQAKRGELVGFIYHNMAQPLPTLASCDVSLLCIVDPKEAC